jgi:hypothetical protein
MAKAPTTGSTGRYSGRRAALDAPWRAALDAAIDRLSAEAASP